MSNLKLDTARVKRMIIGEDTKDSYRIGNNTFAFNRPDGSVDIEYHGNRIASIGTDRWIMTTLAGWGTATTRLRLNIILLALTALKRAPYGQRNFEQTYFNGREDVVISATSAQTNEVSF